MTEHSVQEIEYPVIKCLVNKRTVIVKTIYTPGSYHEIIWYPKKWRNIDIFSLDDFQKFMSKAFNINLDFLDYRATIIGRWK